MGRDTWRLATAGDSRVYAIGVRGNRYADVIMVSASCTKYQCEGDPKSAEVWR